MPLFMSRRTLRLPRIRLWLRPSAGPLAFVWALVCALAAPAVQAQMVSEAAVKAGFVFNFIKFTQWPGQREGAPIRLCAASAQPLDGQLSLLHGRSVGSRPIDVRQGTPVADWRQCDVLFLGEDDADRLPLLPPRPVSPRPASLLCRWSLPGQWSSHRQRRPVPLLARATPELARRFRPRRSERLGPLSPCS